MNTILNGITPIAQIIIAVAVSIVVILLLILIIFKGIHFRSNTFNIEVDSNGKKKKVKKESMYYVFSVEDMESIIEILSSFLERISEVSDFVSMQRKMDMVENRLSFLYEHKNQFFANKLIEKGIPSNNIASHIDYLHYKQVIDRILYLDDGNSPSIKALIRKHLRDRTYTPDPNLSEAENRNKFDKFVSNVIDEIIQKTKRIWNDNYRSDVIDFDGNTHKKRIVSVEEIEDFEDSESSVEVQRSILSEIFKHAIQTDIWAENEKKTIKEDRKKQIQMFLLKRRE